MKQRKQFLCILLAVVLLLSACGAADNGWQEQYDLGMRYLREGNYQEAILAFAAAIAIDDQRPEAYMGRGEAYAHMGDLEKALEDFYIALELAERNGPNNEELRKELEIRIEDVEQATAFWEETPDNDWLVLDAYWEVVPNPNEEADDYCYHIPMVDLGFVDDSRINGMIYEELNRYLEENVDENGDIRYGWIAYDWYVRGNIVSILVAVTRADQQGTDYYLYNINTETGMAVSDQEVLESYGMDEETFRQRVAEKTGSDNVEARPYVGPERKLCILASGYLYALSGNGYTVHPECQIENATHIDGRLREDLPIYEGYIFDNSIVYSDWIDNMHETFPDAPWSAYGIRFDSPVTVVVGDQVVTLQEASVGGIHLFFECLESIGRDRETGIYARVRINCEICPVEGYCEPGYTEDVRAVGDLGLSLKPNGPYWIRVTNFEIIE